MRIGVKPNIFPIKHGDTSKYRSKVSDVSTGSPRIIDLGKDNASTSSGNVSCVTALLWIVLCAWIGLILACWHTGLISLSTISHKIIEVEEIASTKAHHLLRGKVIGSTFHSSIQNNNHTAGHPSPHMNEAIASLMNHSRTKSLNPLIHPSGHLISQPINQNNQNIKEQISPSTGAKSQIESKSSPSATAEESPPLQVIFSTDCNPFQDWQTLVLFHSALVVGQTSPITRICGGCSEEKKVELKNLYAKLYANTPNPDQFRIHFTPDFSHDETTGKQYNFYNKPRGLQHWLDYGNHSMTDKDVIALLDPDMIFLRPLTTNIRGMPNNLWDKKHIRPEDLPHHVTEGLPVAQLYGLGAPWTNDNHKKFNRGKICGEGSSCLLPNERQASQHYSVGPPYIANKKDMQRISKSWNLFVPRVYNGGYPYLLAEMYAYSMAAAHESLPHLQMEHYMVSNHEAGGEGWPLIDQLDDSNVCKNADSNGIFLPTLPLPVLIHYCQSFSIRGYLFGKRRTPSDIFDCTKPLFIELPGEFGVFPEKDAQSDPKQDKKARLFYKRNAFMVCTIHRAINAAIIHYRSIMCPNENNLEKTYHLP